MFPSNTKNAVDTGTSGAEPYRPKLHFSARREWINDPNGLVYLNGNYHLFFQCNPDGTQWGNMSWGHAVSRDLISWTQQEHAILQRRDPDDASRIESIFSGCTVLDADNVSGLGRPDQPALLAFYTSHYDRAKPPYGRQVQSLAYSLDQGQTWTFYGQNPVLGLRPGNIQGFNADEFRDPKIFFHKPSGRWIMLLVLATDRKVAFYASTNLLDWEFQSVFSDPGDTDDFWEVPDLLELPIEGTEERRWLLVVSLNNHGTHQSAGSLMVYFIGDFDGRDFHFRESETPDHRDGAFIGDNRFDWGRDYYAAISFHNAPQGEAVMMGWMNNWRYAGNTPTRAFRGQMSLARAIGLRRWNTYVLPTQRPLGLRVQNDTGMAEVSGISLTAGASRSWPITQPVPLRLTVSGRLEQASLRIELGFGEETLFVAIDPHARTICMDRRGMTGHDVHPDFPVLDTAHSVQPLADLVLNIIIDSASVELFAQGGSLVITQQVFPVSALSEIRLLAPDGVVESVSFKIDELSSTGCLPT